MSNQKLTHVILDLDQTITTDESSWLQFTSLLGGDSEIHKKIYEDFKNGITQYEEAKSELINYWRRLDSLTRESIKRAYSKIEYREGVVEAINYLKTKYKLFIITGATDIVAEVVAEKFGIEDYFAVTDFIFNEKGILVDFDYTLDRGEKKLEEFLKYCEREELDPGQCIAIGDGDSDLPIFEKVGLPILFLADETSKELKSNFGIHLEDWRDIRKII